MNLRQTWSLSQVVPLEILTEIFTIALPARDSEKYIVALHSVGSVCSQWKGATLTAPMLWSSIYVNVSDHYPERQKEFVETWAHRSGGWPLSITLVGGQLIRGCHVIEGLAPSMNRWQRLNLHNSSSEFLQSLFGDPTHNFPRLELLCTSGLTNFEFDAEIRATSSAEFAPALRILNMGYKMIPDPWISWDQLTEIHLQPNFYHLLDCLELLRTATSLVTAAITIDSSRTDGYPPQSYSTIRPPNLSFLRIDIYVTPPLDAGENFPSIFNYLEFPTLQELQFSGYYCDAESFVSCLARSPCSLRKLQVSLTSEPHSGHINFGLHQRFHALDTLLCTPDLEHFSFAWANSRRSRGGSYDPIHIDEDLLKDLTVSETSQVLLVPKLLSLELSTIGHYGFAYQAFVNMIKSRRNLPGENNIFGLSIQRIQSVTLHLEGNIDEYFEYNEPQNVEAFDVLRNLRTGGLEVIIRDTKGERQPW